MNAQKKIEESLKAKSGFSRNLLKYKVNETFFNKWTSQMAYILGFTFADGNIHRSSLSWDIQLRDKDILHKIKKALNASYPIKIQKRGSVKLRINNQMLITGAIGRSLYPKKNIRNELPNIPIKLLRHFIRGYMDGDGWLVLRKNKNEIDLGFCSGNKEFLEDLSKVISANLQIPKPNVRNRTKITPRKVISTTYMFEYYSSNAYKVASWLFDNLNSNDLFLNRKYRKYILAKKLNTFLKSGTKVVRQVQKEQNKSLYKILNELYVVKKYDGVKIANLLNVHSSSVYRWLARTGIKYPTHRLYG